jgi:hypothetical protein
MPIWVREVVANIGVLEWVNFGLNVLDARCNGIDKTKGVINCVDD